ncbi:MAG TPA: hypothetical protein VFP34_16410 [Microlunatus sp.]|nr:hypothetical protein [Microlunatus sp.]
MTSSDPAGRTEPIRILQHNLIDVCELLGATFSLDGTAVSFVRRAGGGVREQWSGHLGDWMVTEDDVNWHLVPDAEFGRRRTGEAQEIGEPAPAPSQATAAASARVRLLAS